MRQIRIYQQGRYQVGQTLELTPEAGQHVGVVLRLQMGAQIILFNGENREFAANIVNVQKKKVMVQIVSEQYINRESPRNIHLAQAISKGERMEWVIQKAVELGVASITPLITEHCAVKLDPQRREKKRLQWQAIAIAACEQSGRNQVPIIHHLQILTDYLQHHQAPLSFFLCPTANKTWRNYAFKHSDIYLFVGPEGGFSLAEAQQMLTSKFQPLSLGPRILRTETAAIAALSILQAVCGDL